jgi:hypothetical protein
MKQRLMMLRYLCLSLSSIKMNMNGVLGIFHQPIPFDDQVRVYQSRH